MDTTDPWRLRPGERAAGRGRPTTPERQHGSARGTAVCAPRRVPMAGRRCTPRRAGSVPPWPSVLVAAEHGRCTRCPGASACLLVVPAPIGGAVRRHRRYGHSMRRPDGWRLVRMTETRVRSFGRGGDGGSPYLVHVAGGGGVRGSDQPAADGNGGRLGAVVDPELGEEVADVGGGGAAADEEGVGDFAVGLAGHQQSEHLVLARGQIEEGGGDWSGQGRV